MVCYFHKTLKEQDLAMQFKKNSTTPHKTLLIAMATTILFPAGAWAQSTTTANANAFTTNGSWAVGSTQLGNVRGLGGVKMPCVLSNEFDNGFIMRLSGGGENMLAMAIDFRQDVFSKGREYPVVLSVGDGYIKQAKATAFTAGTLIFNLRPFPEIYNLLKKQTSLEVSIQDNDFKFSLGNISSQLASLESCYSGTKTPVIEPLMNAKNDAQNAPKDTPVITKIEDVPAQPLPRSFDEIVANNTSETTAAKKDITPLSLPDAMDGKPSTNSAKINLDAPSVNLPDIKPRVSKSLATAKKPLVTQLMAKTKEETPSVVEEVEASPIPLMPAPSQVKPDMSEPTVADYPVLSKNKGWTALTGEDVKVVLARWSERAGYDLDWQAQGSAKVAQSVNLDGSFEEAVAQLVAESGAVSGIEASVKNASSNDNNAAPANALMWQAKKGTDIHTLIDLWAAKGNVSVKWNFANPLPLKNNVNVNGTFDQALSEVLDQFAAEKQRPYGELNINPDTGYKTLVLSLGQ